MAKAAKVHRAEYQEKKSEQDRREFWKSTERPLEALAEYQ